MVGCFSFASYHKNLTDMKHLWWVGSLVSIVLIIILRFTEWRPVICAPKLAEASNFMLESLSFSYLAGAIFFLLNEYIPQRRKNKVHIEHITRQIQSIKEYIRQIVASIEPFKDENEYTQQTFTNTFANKDFRTKFMDGQDDLENYINKRRKLIESLCEQLLSSYTNIMSNKDIDFINTILKSDFIRNTLEPIDFNVPNQYISSYPNNQKEIGISIFKLYNLGKTSKSNTRNPR